MAVFVASPCGASSQSDVLRKVDPEWGPELQSSYYVDVALVHMRVDRGRPFSLDTETPLPDNVVEALAAWRFANSSAAGYDIRISVRRALGAESTGTLHRVWRVARFQDAIARGLNGTRPRSLDLSRNIPVADQEHDIAAELAWYANHAGSPDPDAARKRANAIAFVVENAPESELLASPLATVNPSGDLLGDTSPRDYIRGLWLEHAKRAASLDSNIVFGIANFLELSEPEIVEGLLKNSSLNAATLWMGELLARGALGVSAVNPLSGRATNVSSANAAFSEHARAELQSTNDRRLLASALWTLMTDGQALAAAGRLPTGYASECADLLARWKTADPQSTMSCDTALAPSDVAGAAFMKGSLILPHLLHKTNPLYPESARKERLNGTVKARMIVGTDGRPSRVELLSGPFVLAQPALASLWKWSFEPALANGRPVAYGATVEVNFGIR